MTSLHWTSAAMTNPGRVRSRNEDSVMARDDAGLWCVADGMGGHAAGDVASRLIAATLQKISAPDYLADAVESIDNALQAVHRALVEQGRKQGHLIGATVVAAIARDDLLAVVWAGDSRGYLLRDGRCHDLTRDHTQYQGMLLRGERGFSPEQMQNLQKITRAVGASAELILDIEVVRVKPGDRFMLCSDGLGKHVDSTEFDDLAGRLPAGKAAEALLGAALERGGVDNVSVIVGAASEPSMDILDAPTVFPTD